MTSFASLLSPPFHPPSFYLRQAPSGIKGSSRFFFHKLNSKGRRVLLAVRCSFTGPGDDDESETEESHSSSAPSPSSSTDFSINWPAVLGGIGFVETTYLSFLKLTNSDAFCPIGGGTCGDILNSDYADVFGFPLPLIGMAAYGLVSIIGLQLPGKNLPFGIEEYNGRVVLLGLTTSMAAASAYFLLILSSKFAGASCSYCLLSAFLSISLFFITLKDFGLQEIQKLLALPLSVAISDFGLQEIQKLLALPLSVAILDFGLQEIQKLLALPLSVAILVILTLNSSYSSSLSTSISQAVVELPYVITEVTKPSSPLAISLAKHLHSIGAKMYGAFWCSHCLEQKEMFGREAVKLLDYVECFPDGYRTGTKMDKACIDARIEGFPTWIINGQVVSGEKELSELAEQSGFKSDQIREPI